MVAMLINTRVSVAKTNAWIKPTNISKPMKGSGINNGKRNAITANKTSPAKILPNNLKEKDITLANSLISSKKPTKKLIGLEKLINFLK